MEINNPAVVGGIILLTLALAKYKWVNITVGILLILLGLGTINL